MRGCTCRPDGLQYCAWCQALAARAGVSFVSPATAQRTSAAARAPSVTVLAPQDRYRSQTERRYATLLEHWEQSGEVAAWYYEPVKGLYLAPQLSYTPDFLVYWLDHPIPEWHEVKGAFVRPKDWQRAKMAAALYPRWPFVLAQWKDNQWTWKRIPAV
jgi:hypothetical protein